MSISNPGKREMPCNCKQFESILNDNIITSFLEYVASYYVYSIIHPYIFQGWPIGSYYV